MKRRWDRWITITLAVVILLASFPLPALAQTVDGSTSMEESTWQPTFAEPPSKPAVEAAEMGVEIRQIENNEYLCYWAKVADESKWDASFSQMTKTIDSDSAYSGQKVFVRDGSAWGQQQTTWKVEVEVSADAMPSAELMFLRFQYRGTNVEPWDKIHVNSIRGSWQVVDEQIVTGYVGEGWREWEKVFEPLPMDQRQNLRVWVTNDSDDDSTYEIDQIGIGYCVNADNLQPEISPPGEIGALFGTILLFGGDLYNHGSSAVSSLDPKGLRSFENLWNAGEAFQVLNRRFAANCSPFGITEGCYLGDKFWMAKDVFETWYHADRVSTTRMFNLELAMKDLQSATKTLNKLIARGAPLEQITLAADKVKWIEGKIAFAQKILSEGKGFLLNLPVNYTFEMRPSELSRTFDGGRYSYVYSGQVAWSRLRGISFPAGTTEEVARKIWDIAVRNGAPRFTRLVIGEIEVQISWWSRWAPNLRNWGIPSIMTLGGTVGTMTINAVRAGATVAGEYALPFTGYAAATIAASDLIADNLIYMSLDPEETSMSYGEFMWSESLFAYALSGVGLTSPEHESNIGWNNSVALFCIPDVKKFYVSYELEATSFTHPSICNAMIWRIVEKNDDGVKLQKDGTDVQIMIGSGQSSTYSMVSYDYQRGMIIADFNVRLVRFVTQTNTAVVDISFAGFRTPQELGLCQAWLPANKAQEFGRQQCAIGRFQSYLPLTQSTQFAR